MTGAVGEPCWFDTISALLISVPFITLRPNEYEYEQKYLYTNKWMFLHPFMANRWSGNEALVCAPNSSIIEIYRTESGADGFIDLIQRMCVHISVLLSASCSFFFFFALKAQEWETWFRSVLKWLGLWPGFTPKRLKNQSQHVFVCVSGEIREKQKINIWWLMQ